SITIEEELTPNVLDWGGNFPNMWQHGDFNADGNTDFMYLDTENNWQVRLSNGVGGFNLNVDPISSIGFTDKVLDWGRNFPMSWIHGDFNGDGKLDFMFVDTDDKWQLNLASGIGTYKIIDLGDKDGLTPNIMDWGGNFPNSWQNGDYNTDGRTDIRYLDSSSNWQTLISNGDGSFSTETSIAHSTMFPNMLDWGNNFPFSWIRGEFNGDGASDLFFLTTSETGYKWGRYLTTSQRQMIHTVSDPLGKKVNVTYKRARAFASAIKDDATTPDGQKTCGNAAGYGYQQPCGIANSSARYLVEKITASDGRDSTGWIENAGDYVDSKVTYDYINGRYSPGNFETRSGLGFEKMIQKNIVKPGVNEVVLSTTVTEYRQDAVFDHDSNSSTPAIASPFAGLPIKTTSYIGDVTANIKSKEVAIHYNDDGTQLFTNGLNGGLTQALPTGKDTQEYLDGLPTFAYKDTNGYDSFGRIVNFETCSGSGTIATDCRTTINSLMGTSRGTAWTVGAAWNYKTPEQVVSIRDGIVESGKQFHYLDNNLPTLVTKISQLWCADANTCTTGSGAWRTIEQDYAYYSNGLLQEKTNAIGGRTVYTYTTEGKIESTTKHADSKQYKVKHTYYDSGYGIGKKKSITNLFDPLTESENLVPKTSFEYDELGRLIKETNPKGGTKELFYVSFGDPNSQYAESIITQTVDVNGG
ncbi:MAG: VCBS repeat-containing protein, partial [Bacteroidetes bacterium]|nr:VCBS repeat-containing protein [Bacteroidota bacterium]